MKIKNNTKNLIPRKLIGGFIPKFLNSGQFRRLGISKYHQDPKTKKVYEYNNGKYTLITKPITISNAFLTIAYGPNGETARSYKGLLRGANATGTSEQQALARLPKLPKKEKNMFYTVAKVIPVVKGAYSLFGKTNTKKSKPAPQNPRTQGKPARTTAKPAATPVSTPTENTDTYTIQRGDTLGVIANNLGISVDELAKLNNISNPNRIYAGRTLITKAPAVEILNNIPNGMEYASDYLNASTPDSALSTYNALALNVLSDVDKRIAEIRPTISSRSAYADMEDAMAGWDLKRKLKMMDASVGTAWDWNTEEGRKNFVGMANLMKNGKGNYNKVYDQWIASQPKTTESQNGTLALRSPLDYRLRLLKTPITDNLSLTTQLSANQPSIGWVNTLAILDIINRAVPQLSVGNTDNNDFATLELPQNFSEFATDLFRRKRTGNWTFAKRGTKLIRRK